jgi:hypothetical protein
MSVLRAAVASSQAQAVRKITGDWRKLHNEELQNFYLSPDIRIVNPRG